MGVNYLEIVHNDYPQRLEIADSQKQLVEAKALDDLAFGGHLGISMEELFEITANGAVLLLRNQQGSLTGETQVITSPVSQHPKLQLDEAYNYGTAVHPDHQNKGLSQILFKGQEQVAIKAGKTKNTLTVRLENAQSLRGRFKLGYRVTGYNPDYYGPFSEGGARLIMEKIHSQTNIYPSAALMSKLAVDGKVLIVDQHNIDNAIQNGAGHIGIMIKIGDQIDFTAHPLVASVFGTNKFVGIGLLKPDEFNSPQGESLLVLEHR